MLCGVVWVMWRCWDGCGGEGDGCVVFEEFGYHIGRPVPHTICMTFVLRDLPPFLLSCHSLFDSHLTLIFLPFTISHQFPFIPSSNRSISIHILGMDSTQCIIDRFKPVFHEIEARRDDGHSEEIAEPFTVISYVPLIWIEG